MQAIILAAGMGKRLGKLTENATKCMVRVNDGTLIEHALEALAKAGIKRVILVVGYCAEKLRAFLDGRYPELDITYVMNEVYDKTNNIYSLWLAREHLAADDTILLESDLIFEPSILTELISDPEANLAVVSKFEAWMDGTVTLVDQDRNIVSVIDKSDFKWERVEDYYKTVNIYKFSAEFSKKYYLPFLNAYLSAFGDNKYYEQVLKVLAFLEEGPLKAHPVSGSRWYEIDDPNDLAVAEMLFSAPKRRLELTQKRYGGYWRFPAMLDYCYLVNPYFPPKRLFKEMESSFRDLVTQYPSGAQVQSALAGKVFGVDPQRIVVGNGAAELIDVLVRLVPGKMAVAMPTFNEYPARFGADRTIQIPTSDRDFDYRPQDLLDAAPAADILILVNPDNPSGHFICREEVRSVIDRLLAAGKLVVVDESFADFAEPERRFTLLEDTYLAERPGLFVVKSISKSYGVPGVRLGILCTGDVERADAIRKASSVWNINSLAEFFLQIVDKYRGEYRAACDALAAERLRFASRLAATGRLTVYPSQANFLLCRINDGTGSCLLAEQLLSAHDILVKDLTGRAGFPEGQFIRLAVRRSEENDRLVEAVRRACGKGRGSDE